MLNAPPTPEPPSAPAQPELRGHLTASRLGRGATVLLALGGVLFLLRATRLLARWFLARRNSVRVTLGQSGLHLVHRTTVLGKLTREGELLIPLSNLNRVERVVRYDGIGFYAGAVALCAGAYVGTQLMIDAVRATPVAWELLTYGPLVIGLGLLLDFLLVTGFDNARGRCQLRVITKDGLRLQIGALDAPLLDGLLRSLTARLEQTPPEQPQSA